MTTTTASPVLDALAHIAPGHEVTVDLIRDALDASQATSREIGDGLAQACRDGYLTGLGPAGYALCRPSTHPAAKARLVRVYRRTRKAIR